MVRHQSLRAALVATIVGTVFGTVSSTVLFAGPAHSDDTDLLGTRATSTAKSGERAAVSPSRRAARRAAARATPLAVTIDTLTPASIPAQGEVQVAGTVTNTDTVPWQTINVYSFISEEPLTTQAQLANAVQADETQQVGERILEVGSFATIDALQPGESQTLRALRRPRPAGSRDAGRVLVRGARARRPRRGT